MAEASEQVESTGSKFKFIAKVGAIYSSIIALVSDILQPLLDFTLLFLCLCGLMLVAEILLGFYTRSDKGRALNEKLLQLTDGYWFRTILVSTALSFCVLLGMFLLNDGTEDGFLAEHSETVRVLQKELGLMNERMAKIEENTRQTAESAKEIAEHSKATAENTRETAEAAKETAGNTAEIAETSKETAEHAKTTADNTGRLVEQGEKTTELLELLVNPQDARKKLAQLGIPYTIEGFRSKVMEGNLEALKLFYQAGWDPLTTSGGWPGVSPIFMALAQQSPNYLAVLAQAIEEGKYDPNKKIKCDILNTFTQNVTQLFDWLNAPNVFIYSHNKTTQVNLGYLISLLIKMPDDQVCSFVSAFGLDMKDGIAMRNSIINKNYILKVSKKYNNNMFSGMPPSIAKQLGSVPDSVLMNALFPPAKEKLFQKRSKEYRRGTQMLAEAAEAESENPWSQSSFHYKPLPKVSADDAKKELSRKGIIQPSRNDLQKAITQADAETCGLLFAAGVDPNESGNAWLIFKSFVDANPASERILQTALQNGFDLNREVTIEQDDARAFMADQRRNLEKWFSADGDMENQKLITGNEVDSNGNSFNLAAILSLVSPDADPRLKGIAKGLSMDMSRGVALRNNLHSAYKNGFSYFIDKINAFIKRENEIYDKMLTLKDCKNLDKYAGSDFVNGIGTPLTSTLFSSADNVYESIKNECSTGGNAAGANRIIAGVMARFPEKTKEFDEKVSRLKIPEVTARLNKYKKATAAISDLGR